jgi:hypothetical protein
MTIAQEQNGEPDAHGLSPIEFSKIMVSTNRFIIPGFEMSSVDKSCFLLISRFLIP